jgi:hypothetical protein
MKGTRRFIDEDMTKRRCAACGVPLALALVASILSEIAVSSGKR